MATRAGPSASRCRPSNAWNDLSPVGTPSPVGIPARDPAPVTDPCRHCFVSGRVQGVFFRASAREKGRELGLEVHARNLTDGRVEVLASGPGEALETLIAWLHEGPPQAEVIAVACESISRETFARLSRG